MITQESGWNADARSPYAIGIAQFTPDTARSLGINPSNPQEALYGAAHLMRAYLDQFGNYADALTAYNAGPGAVGKPLVAETQTYLQDILGSGQGGSPGIQWPWSPKPPTGPNPQDPTTWSGDERTKFLGTSGYRWQGGNGDNAIWLAPDGSRVTEAQAFNNLLGWTDAKGTFHPPVDIHPTASSQQIQNDPAYVAASIAEKQANAASLTGDLALKQQAQSWLQNYQKWQMATGDTKAANDTQQQIFTNALAIQNLQDQRTKMQADLDLSIGTLAQNPGDISKYIGTTMAAQGFGAGGGSYDAGQFTSPDSLRPLNGLLQAQRDLANAGTPTAPSFVFPQSGPYGQPPAAPSAQAAPPNHALQPSVPAAGTGPQFPDVPGAGLPGAQPAPVPPYATQGNPGDVAPQGYYDQIPAAASGGVETGAYISGEAGPEINIPTKDGAVVLNAAQAKHMGINLDKLAKMAAGGIFSAATPAAPKSVFGDTDTSLASNFVGELVKRLGLGMGFANPTRPPGPVFASSPGFNPIAERGLQQLNTANSGIPPEAFDYFAKLLAPQGINPMEVRRSA